MSDSEENEQGQEVSIVPEKVRDLRACLFCGLVKTRSQFIGASSPSLLLVIPIYYISNLSNLCDIYRPSSFLRVRSFAPSSLDLPHSRRFLAHPASPVLSQAMLLRYRASRDCVIQAMDATTAHS